MSFLVDTGADYTVVHPRDMLNLGIRASYHFTGSAALSSQGIGGSAEIFPEPCDLFLEHDDGTIDQLALTIYFASPNSVNDQYPSLLGRDVLSYYRFTFHQASGLVTLDVP